MDEDSSNKFIGSLTKFLQSLCNGYVEFQRGVELVGHIYLNIDTGEKVDYILHERVSKNDENSVSFVSNSFHAQPQDKTKETPSKPDAKNSSEKSHDDDDDDDIMIVDHSQGPVGSTNSGSVLPRGVKRLGSPGADYRHNQRARASAGSSSAQNTSSHSFPSVNRQHSGRPSATVTSQGGSQNENLNISEVKLEQISRDELLSLASQVSDGTAGAPHSSSSASRSQPQHSGMSSGRGEAAMWVKQEVTDDGGGGTDAVYDVHLGQYYTKRSSLIQAAKSAEAQLMFDQSQPIRKNTLYQRQYRERLKQNPELYRRYRRLQSQYEKKCREKRKRLQEQLN